jgi:impB/mucB/samB family C-terminal.
VLKQPFKTDIKERQHILEQLNQLLSQALVKLNAKKLSARTVTIKIKYHDFVQITRSQNIIPCHFIIMGRDRDF